MGLGWRIEATRGRSYEKILPRRPALFKPGRRTVSGGSIPDLLRLIGQGDGKGSRRCPPRGLQAKPQGLPFCIRGSKEVERYWRTHDGLYLYEVEIEGHAIWHCGDMHLTDEIGAEFRKVPHPANFDRGAQLAKEYWNNGDRTARGGTTCKICKSSTKLKGKSDVKAYVRSQVREYDPANDPPLEETLGIKDAAISEKEGRVGNFGKALRRFSDA